VTAATEATTTVAQPLVHVNGTKPAVAPTRLPCRFLSCGTSLPEAVLTNADLETRMDTSDAWIVERTGIRERRVAAPSDTTASLATAAGQAALDRAGVAADQVDLVVLATMTPDQIFPATASAVQHALGTAGAAFDLNAACAGFVYALHAAASMLVTGGLRHVLLIGAERCTAIIDPADRGTAILFGDGAGALLLGAVDDPAPDAPGIMGIDLGGDGSGREFLQVPPGEQFMRMDGREVFRRATRGVVASCGAALERAGVTPDELALLVPHQANQRIIDAVAGRFGLPPERVAVNIDRYGNTSAASVPIALAEAVDAGRLAPGDRALLTAIGGGMAWASAVIRWGA
jgi:3-oxoacyl-[acyl-carrier-protein] synthase III